MTSVSSNTVNVVTLLTKALKAMAATEKNGLAIKAIPATKIRGHPALNTQN
jgi:hypothetical protein